MTAELDPDQLLALAAAVSEGTFEAAAQRLHITPSAVSQRIKALENRTGRVLLRRSKPIAPTESGAVLLRAARQLEAIAADVAHQLGADQLGPPQVALAVNADSLATWFLPALRPLADSVIFDLRREDETQTARLLRDGSVLAAVTASEQPVPGCTVQLLGAMRYRACAAPGFIARWLPDGGTARELTVAPVVVFDRHDLLQDRYLRERCGQAVEPPRHYVPGSGAFVSGVAMGLGWGMLPDLQTDELLAQGALISFDDQGLIDVPLFWQQWRLRSDALDRVADAVRRAAAATLV